MKMKRKTTALLLALMMCLLLLSACGANNTPDAEEPPASGNTSAEQQPADEKEEEPKQEPEQEEPEQEEPEKAEEPAQEEPEEVNNAGTEFLALLQEEYENGFFEGEGPRHTYYRDSSNQNYRHASFIYNGIVYIPVDYIWANFNGDWDKTCYVTYDIASKEFSENACTFSEGYNNDSIYFIDGNFYSFKEGNFLMYDCNGVFLNKVHLDNFPLPFDKGFLCALNDGAILLLSYNLEEIAEIPVRQREIEHGLKEDMKLSYWFAADGTVYAGFQGDDSLYRLNTDTYEWENTGNAPTFTSSYLYPFLGKYVLGLDNIIYDRITGEQIFEYGELDLDGYLYSGCFVGDKYLGTNGSEYRWVNLTDLSMSEPLTFPEGKDVTILNDTYCIYQDKYGLFLWNYNDGTEETIMMFDN